MIGHAAPKPPKTVLAGRLRVAQSASGLSNRELAHRLGVSESLLAKWKRGANAPSVRNLARLARIFGCSVASLSDPEDLAA